MRHFVYLLVAHTVLATIGTRNISAELAVPLPYNTTTAPISTLYELVDKDLEQKLTATINSNKTWSRLCQKKKLAVGIVDISNPERARFARINGSTMMYAASLPKVAVLLTAAQCLEDGTLVETPDILDDMRRMMSRSDNAATTRLIDLMGFKKIEQVLTDPRYQLYNPKRGGGLWVGKRYAATGERHPDPMQGISHAASVTQVCRFYYLMAMGQLINPRRSQQMLEMMADPELHHKFVSVLDKRAPEATLFRKSGSWKVWHSDSVLVWGPEWRRYIAVGIVEHEDGEKIMRHLMGVLDDLFQQDYTDHEAYHSQIENLSLRPPPARTSSP